MFNYSILILKSFNNYREHARGFSEYVQELSRACSRVFQISSRFIASMLAGFPNMFKNYREHARVFSKADWRIPKGVGSI